VRFEDRTVVVTGGARGIGAETAARFSREGARVAIVDRLAQAGEQTASALTAEGADVRFFAADVSRPQDVEGVVHEVVQTFAGIDVLVNNAAVTLPKSYEDTSPDEWDTVLAVNLRSAYLFLRAGTPYLKRAVGASVINVASFHARSTLERFGAYAASKAGLIGLTQSAALDLAPHGVRVNAVCPGIVETAMWQTWIDQVADADAATNEVLALQPLGRIGRPADVAGVIAFLASDDAAYVTGSALYVDGGVSARLSHV
jgi:NAD(P)-dependent dehydrogenase (short-subunit alcohol dehydrogenase family)